MLWWRVQNIMIKSISFSISYFPLFTFFCLQDLPGPLTVLHFHYSFQSSCFSTMKISLPFVVVVVVVSSVIQFRVFFIPSHLIVIFCSPLWPLWPFTMISSLQEVMSLYLLSLSLFLSLLLFLARFFSYSK